MAINEVCLTGRLAQDARISDTSSGRPCARFSIAVPERSYDDSARMWHDRPCYFDCVLFGNRAPALLPYLLKGTKVSLHGRLSQRRWTQEGKRMSKVDVVVDEVELMSLASSARTDDPELADEDIPF